MATTHTVPSLSLSFSALLACFVCFVLLPFATAQSDHEPPLVPTVDAPFEWRIVNGTPATLGEFPGMVSLQTRSSFHFCGGTWFHALHVLTAAHCMTDERGRLKSTNSIKVIGDVLTLTVSNAARQNRLVTHIFVHTGYNLRTMRNDIAVVRLATAFSETRTFRPVALATTLPTVDASCHVAGWGLVEEEGDASPSLHRMTVGVLSAEVCNRRESYNGLVVPGLMICAGVMEGGRDSCNGDSGGGLYCGNSGEVTGLVSFGYGCARANYPGVYAAVGVQSEFVRGALEWTGSQHLVPVPTTVAPGTGGAHRQQVGQLLVVVWVALALVVRMLSVGGL